MKRRGFLKFMGVVAATPFVAPLVAMCEPKEFYGRGRHGMPETWKWSNMPFEVRAVCSECGDYSYLELDDVAHVSQLHCAICGGILRPSTPQEMCDACNNPHRNDFRHTCGAKSPGETL